jgi:hypothetical protein
MPSVSKNKNMIERSVGDQAGYTANNVQIVVWLYNRAKGDGTHEDVMQLVEALSAQHIRKAA